MTRLQAQARITKWGVAISLVLLAAALPVWLIRSSPTDQARALLRTRPRQAELLLREILKDDPSCEASLLLARALGTQSLWQEAATIVDTIQSADCSSRDYFDLGQLAHHHNQPQLAEVAFGHALRLGASRGEVLRHLIFIHQQTGTPEQVLEDCAELARLYPRDPQPWLVMGRVHERLTQPVEAIEALRKAIKRGARARDLRRYIVRKLIDIGRLEEARGEMETLRNKGSLDPQLSLLDAQLLRLEGEPAQSLKAVQSILNQSSENDTPAADKQWLINSGLVLRGTLYSEQGELEKAQQDLARVVADDPYHQKAHYLLGLVYSRQQQNQLSEKHLANSRRISRVREEIYLLQNRAGREPDNRSIRIRLSELNAEIGRDDLAKQWSQRANDLERTEN